MKKTLVFYARICPGPSQHTQKLFELFESFDDVTAIRLDGSVPFDAKREQEFLNQFDNIVFLFTINWFNIPWNLARYLAEVWRVGDFRLNGKKVYLVVTTGSGDDFYHNKTFGWDAHDYLNNVRSVVTRLHGINGGEWIYHGASSYDPERFNAFLERIKNAYLNVISKDEMKPEAITAKNQNFPPKK